MNNKVINYSPYEVVWETTLQCNLRCAHCDSKYGLKRKKELTTGEALELCDNLGDIGFKQVNLTGGEVFLRKDWKKIAEEIKDCQMRLLITTNGFFKPDKIIKKLAKLETDFLMIGMDGGNSDIQDTIRNVEGSYKKAWDFIKAAKKEGIRTGIITTVHKLNYKELTKIRRKVLKEKLDWLIQPAGVSGHFSKGILLDEEEYYNLANFIYSNQKRHDNKNFSIFGSQYIGFHSKKLPPLSMNPDWEGCLAGISVLGIQSNGYVKGCISMPDNFIEDNIRRRNIKDIWNDPDSFSYNRQFNDKDIGQNCEECKFSDTCKGGCTTRSYKLTGENHNDPFCLYRYEINKEGNNSGSNIRKILVDATLIQ